MQSYDKAEEEQPGLNMSNGKNRAHSGTVQRPHLGVFHLLSIACRFKWIIGYIQSHNNRIFKHVHAIYPSPILMTKYKLLHVLLCILSRFWFPLQTDLCLQLSLNVLQLGDASGTLRQHGLLLLQRKLQLNVLLVNTPANQSGTAELLLQGESLRNGHR